MTCIEEKRSSYRLLVGNKKERDHQLMHSTSNIVVFTATATHLHPPGCQYCYHYTLVLSVLHGLITLYNEDDMIIGNVRSQASQKQCHLQKI